MKEKIRWLIRNVKWRIYGERKWRKECGKRWKESRQRFKELFGFDFPGYAYGKLIDETETKKRIAQRLKEIDEKEGLGKFWYAEHVLDNVLVKVDFGTFLDWRDSDAVIDSITAGNEIPISTLRLLGSLKGANIYVPKDEANRIKALSEKHKS